MFEATGAVGANAAAAASQAVTTATARRIAGQDPEVPLKGEGGRLKQKQKIKIKNKKKTV